MDGQVLREYVTADEQDVVDLSLRAWAPVFASLEDVLGLEINRRLHGEDWRPYQAASVRATLSAPGAESWVAETDGEVTGFVVARVLDETRGLGEIEMLAVDPSHQGTGLGTRLTELATEWLRQQGMRVAMIGTGGDPGHAPARRTYEKANYTVAPMARYFKAL